MRALASLSLALVAASAASAAPALAGGNELSAIGSTRALRSSSADALTGDSLGGGTISYERDLPWRLLPRLDLAARASFAWGDASGEMFQTTHTDLSTLELSVGARARYEIFRRLAASARLDLGGARTAVTLEPPSSATQSARRWEPAVSAAVGLDVIAIARPGFALGLRAELGYTAAAPAPLVLTPAAADDGTLHLPATMAPFGHLDVSGPTFGLGVITQF